MTNFFPNYCSLLNSIQYSNNNLSEGIWRNCRWTVSDWEQCQNMWKNDLTQVSRLLAESDIWYHWIENKICIMYCLYCGIFVGDLDNYWLVQTKLKIGQTVMLSNSAGCWNCEWTIAIILKCLKMVRMMNIFVAFFGGLMISSFLHVDK